MKHKRPCVQASGRRELGAAFLELIVRYREHKHICATQGAERVEWTPGADEDSAGSGTFDAAP
ncbi:MAG: hypothetical protein NVSMB6_05560 [Burkholderiaceae bacterium]